MRAAVLVLLIAAASALPSSPAKHRRSIDKSSRLYNGIPAIDGQFPYQVYILTDNTVSYSGALISTSWVITASRVTYGHISWTLYLGTLNIHAAEPGRVTDVPLYSVLPTGDPFNEVALLRLSREVEVNTYINIVYLPLISDGDFTGTQATVSGWGLDVTYPIEDLHYSSVTVVSNAYCQGVLGVVVPINIMCTNANGVEVAQVCSGDIGAPLVEVNINKLLGVAAAVTPGDCGSSNPDLFHRVHNYLSWISTVTGIVIS